MFTALSYIGAHWMLIISCVLGVIALGAFAWFAKNWKAALAAVVLVIAALAYQSADLGGYKRRVDEDKAAEIKTLQTRLLALNMVTVADTNQAMADAKLNTTMETLSRETPKNDGPCLDRAAAGRVRAIGPLNILPLAATSPARRHSIVLPGLSKRP